MKTSFDRCTSKNLPKLATLGAILGILLLAIPQVEAAGKKKKSAAPAASAVLPAGKRILALAPVERVRIEMPDNEVRDFGDDFLARLRNQ